MSATILTPVKGASAAVVIPLAASGVNITGVHSTLQKMEFDNLGNGSKGLIAVPAGAADAASAPNIDWQRSDGVITRVTGVNKIVSGEDGSDITSQGGSTPTHHSITLVSNDAPSNRTQYATWKAFIKALRQLYDVPCLVVLACGHDLTGDPTKIGFIALIGKLTTEIDLGVDGNTPKQLTMTFTSMTGVAIDSSLETTLAGSTYLPTITPTQGAAVDFPALTADDLHEIEDSEYVII